MNSRIRVKYNHKNVVDAHKSCLTEFAKSMLRVSAKQTGSPFSFLFFFAIFQRETTYVISCLLSKINLAIFG